MVVDVDVDVEPVDAGRAADGDSSEPRGCGCRPARADPARLHVKDGLRAPLDHRQNHPPRQRSRPVRPPASSRLRSARRRTPRTFPSHRPPGPRSPAATPSAAEPAGTRPDVASAASGRVDRLRLDHRHEGVVYVRSTPPRQVASKVLDADGADPVCRVGGALHRPRVRYARGIDACGHTGRAHLLTTRFWPHASM